MILPTTVYGRFAARTAQLLIGLSILACIAFAQQDVQITQTGFSRTLVFNGTWTGSGIGALANNYI